MPPKKQQTKNDKKKTQKSTEDKTFGLKNKNKSSKVQKYIQQVQTQATNSARGPGKTQKELQAEKKQAEKKRLDELAELNMPVQIVQKVPLGTDPKTVLCINFKNNNCDRGSKCKFSHDLDIGRKSEKRDLYTDVRGNAPDEKLDDTMDTWDQSKLEEVVKSKSGKQPPTDIVCKYFLEAIENSKYGWFWECPNGGDDCKYMHALPPGFILKSKGAKKDEKKEISLEELVEIERHQLGTSLTPVTLETFNEWKSQRQNKKNAGEAKERKEKETRWKAGRSQGMSGRDLFDFNPSLAVEADDDDDAIDLNMYDRAETEQEREDQDKNRLTTDMSHLSLQDSHAKEGVTDAEDLNLPKDQ